MLLQSARNGGTTHMSISKFIAERLFMCVTCLTNYSDLGLYTHNKNAVVFVVITSSSSINPMHAKVPEISKTFFH